MDQTNNKYPSTESRDGLNKLSQDFRPDDVKFLLALNSDVSIEECRDNAMESVEVLKKYVESNHSIDKNSGLNLLSVRRNRI